MWLPTSWDGDLQNCVFPWTTKSNAVIPFIPGMDTDFLKHPVVANVHLARVAGSQSNIMSFLKEDVPEKRASLDLLEPHRAMCLLSLPHSNCVILIPGSHGLS